MFKSNVYYLLLVYLLILNIKITCYFVELNPIMFNNITKMINSNLPRYNIFKYHASTSKSQF